MDGSMVYGCYQNEEYKKIKKYCIGDVEALSGLFERVYPWIKIEQPKEENNSNSFDEELSKSFENAGCIK